jgi:hypothetical protein
MAIIILGLNVYKIKLYPLVGSDSKIGLDINPILGCAVFSVIIHIILSKP